MIRLGLRLAVAGGREAITRLALIAIAVAVGSALLLSTLAAINAFDAQNQRYAWLETGYGVPGAPAATDVDPLWWRLWADFYEGEIIGRVDLAATGPNSPAPPGLSKLPGPGEYYASPALARLLASSLADELGDRYPGTMVGTIGDDGLPAPDTLIIVIGHEPEALAANGNAQQVTAISTVSPADCAPSCAPGVGTSAEGMTLVLSVVAAALLFPVLVFIGGATRLSAARREQRFAAMRLIGATPRQISAIATIESSVATVVGVAVGFAVFAVIRPMLADIPFSGERFFAVDLSLTTVDVSMVAVGIPVAAAIAARLALRKVSISPLGVTRRVTPQAPKGRRIMLLVAGIAWLAYLASFSDIGESGNSDMQALAYLTGIFAIMFGLVVAGPWLTLIGARVTIRRATRPAGLIAARRLGDNPQAAFRAVSGVVLAVFVGTCAIGIITTIVAYNDGAIGDSKQALGTLVYQQFRAPVDGENSSLIDSGDVDVLLATQGIEGVAAVYEDPSVDTSSGPPQSYAACADIAVVSALGHCPQGADVVAVQLRLGGAVINADEPMSDITWPAADVGVADLAAFRIGSIVVSTDGTRASVERARTVLEQLLPSTFAPQTLAEYRARSAEDINRFRQLADVVLIASLPIAGCSLAVSIAGGLADRRRPFSLLRLTGAPLSMLRRVVSLEAAVPLLISVVVAAGAGMAAAGLFLEAQLDQTLQPPTVQYYALIGLGILVSLAIIASTLPLLARITGPETTRNE